VYSPQLMLVDVTFLSGMRIIGSVLTDFIGLGALATPLSEARCLR
jgi:hypothetical protein